MVNNQVNVGPLSVSYADSSPLKGSLSLYSKSAKSLPFKGEGDRLRWRGLIIRNERMTIMELDQMLTAAANYGFPMLISCYLLVRMENKIDQLSANIDALTRVIAAAK